MANLPENTTYSAMTNAAYSLGKSANAAAPKVASFSGLKNTVQSTANQQAQPTSISGITSGVITVPYGGSTKYESFHPAVDIANKIGTPIQSFAGGKVTEVVTGKKQGDKGYGNYVIITDNNGNKWRYSHLNKAYVNVGQSVGPAEQIGEMGNCFDKETEVLTDNGWKPFKLVESKDLVMTLDIKTNKIEFQRPTAYIARIYKKMFKFKNKNIIDFIVSDDHRMLIKLHQDQKLKFIQLKDLPNRSYIKQQGFKWVGKEKKRFIIPESTKRVNQSNKTIKLDKVSIDMDYWVQFLGIWLSDGWMVNTTKSGKYLGITQSFNNSGKRKKIKDILSNIPFNFYEANDDFRLNNIQVYNHLINYGLKNNKTIPDYIFELSPRQIRLFLDAFHLGDGWNHKSTKYYVFGEKKLADQVQQLILMAGGSAIINEIDPKSIKRKKIPEINGKKVIAKNKYWTITETKINYASIIKKEIEEIDYNDYAYCLTVPNSTLYVRRNGKPMFCGNSGSTYSLSGGTGSHLDLRLQNAAGKYLNPLSYRSTK